MKALHKILIGLGIAGAGAVVVAKASASSTGAKLPTKPKPQIEPPNPYSPPPAYKQPSPSNAIAQGDFTAVVTAPSGLHVRATPSEKAVDKGLLAQGTRVKWTEGTFPATAGGPKGWAEVTAPIAGYMSIEWLHSEGKAFDGS